MDISDNNFRDINTDLKVKCVLKHLQMHNVF